MYNYLAILIIIPRYIFYQKSNFSQIKYSLCKNSAIGNIKDPIAFIKDQDVVTSVNNQKIDSYQKALQVFAKAKNYPEIKVSLLRNGEIRNLNYRFDN